MLNFEICLSPDLIHLFDLKGKTVVIVDILRATSCMVTALAHDVEAIIPVAKLEDCKKLQQDGYLAAAERDGMKVAGFDLDNSPFSYMNPSLKFKTIAITTTNGTQAIEKSKSADHIVIGAFLNISSVAKIISDLKKNVIVVCAGWKGNFNLEDTLFGGALAHKLKDKFAITQDAAISAMHVYETVQSDIYRFVTKSQHVQRLANLGITKDIEFCLSFDMYDIVPIFEQNQLISLEKQSQIL